MTEADKYKVPTDAEVHAIRLRLNKLPLRTAFYSKLDNPHWVTALAKQDVFKNPPATEVMPDGLVRSDVWPEIDYLVRMAPIVSSEVAAVLEPIAGSTNQWVRRGIMEACTVMDPADVARLVPKMKQWPGDELANFRLDPRDISSVIVRLLEGGQHAKGMQLAVAFFGPRPAARPPKYGIPEPDSGMELYWYHEELPKVAAALGRSRVPTLVKWLRAYQEHSTSFSGASGSDMSYIWRPIIRESPEHSGHEIGDALVDELRAALVDSLGTSTDAVCALLADDQPLLRRIALDVLAEAIEGVEDKSAERAAASSEYEQQLAQAAQRVLEDETFIDSNYRGEYVPFVRACLGWRLMVDVSPFFEEVRRGPLSLRDERRERFAQEGDTPEQAEERREDYRKHWQHSMLTLVGHGLLPDDLDALLSSLDEQYGVIEVRDELVHIELFTGSTSPIDVETMRAMDNGQLLDHLAKWHADPDTFMGPTHEGQGRVLAEVVAKDPTRFVSELEHLKTLRPTYIRAVVQGWRSAVEAGLPLPWDSVLTFAEWVVGLHDDIKVEGEGDEFDDDRDYRALKSELLRLIESGLSAKQGDESAAIPCDLAVRVLGVLTVFASDPEPAPEYEAEYGGDSMDPLTLSLNTTRPVAVRALIRLVHRFSGSATADAALSLLDQHLDGHDESLAVAAAFGEGTGRLYDSVQPWIEERVGILYGNAAPTSPWQQVALSTALATHRVHMALIELLRGPLSLTIEQMPDTALTAGWRTHTRTFPQLIGDWLVTAMIGGHLAPDDPLVEAWFTRADADLRGEVLGHLAWQTMHWRTVPDDVLERVAVLWDRRTEHVREHPEDAAELSGAYWFARSDKLGPEWWLPRLEYASSVIPNYDMHGMVGEKLARVAATDPDTSLKILENVLTDAPVDHGLMYYDLIEHAVPQVIAAALDSGDAEVANRAADLMNRLGDRGHIGLKERVEKLRAPGFDAEQ
ncbi:MAG: hypothetical protein QMC79_01320 [Anaerosomatales bacterium]|nr:hypothetical protein [Anaerosomatales bacterium]